MPLECALFYNDAQGITGSNIKGGRADSSAIFEIHHQVESPRDRQTGLATGARIHGTFRVLKQIDKATVLLWKMLCENQILPELEFKWYQVVEGVETEYYHHILRNARVFLMETYLPNTKSPELAGLPHVEWVEFGYEQIEWTWDDGGLTHTDDWRKSS